jgi:hypothetical protein
VIFDVVAGSIRSGKVDRSGGRHHAVGEEGWENNKVVDTVRFTETHDFTLQSAENVFQMVLTSLLPCGPPAGLEPSSKKVAKR